MNASQTGNSVPVRGRETRRGQRNGKVAANLSWGSPEMKPKLAAAIAMIAGLAVVPAQAGEASNVLVGQRAFEARCESGGGAIDSGEAIALCDLGDLVVKCDFAGAYTACSWRGAHSNRRLTALLGALPAESLSEGSGGGPSLSPWTNPNWKNK